MTPELFCFDTILSVSSTFILEPWFRSKHCLYIYSWLLWVVNNCLILPTLCEGLLPTCLYFYLPCRLSTVELVLILYSTLFNRKWHGQLNVHLFNDRCWKGYNYTWTSRADKNDQVLNLTIKNSWLLTQVVNTNARHMSVTSSCIGSFVILYVDWFCLLGLLFMSVAITCIYKECCNKMYTTFLMKCSCQ